MRILSVYCYEDDIGVQLEYLTLINNLGCKWVVWVLHVNIKINCCSFSTSGLGYREQCTVHRHTDVHKNTSAPRHVSLHKQKDSHEVNNQINLIICCVAFKVYGYIMHFTCMVHTWERGEGDFEMTLNLQNFIFYLFLVTFS